MKTRLLISTLCALLPLAVLCPLLTHAQEAEYPAEGAAGDLSLPGNIESAVGRIIRKYEETWTAAREQLSAAKTAEEKQKVYQSGIPKPEEAVAEVINQIKLTPDDAAAGAAMGWVAIRWPEGKQLAAMIPLVKQYYLKDAKIAPFVLFADAPNGQENEVISFLQAVITTTPHKEVLGTALYALSVRLAKAEDAASRKLRLEILEKVAKDHKDLVVASNELGRKAAGELFLLKNLTPGQPAPALAGTSLDGKAVSLANHRGKVVLVMFWGDWSANAKKFYPWIKQTENRLAGKPFTVFGVNSDTKEAATAAMTAQGFTFPAIFDGGSKDGPAAASWQIKSWPAFFVLDSAGIVRSRGQLNSKTLDAAIDGALGAKK